MIKWLPDLFIRNNLYKNFGIPIIPKPWDMNIQFMVYVFQSRYIISNLSVHCNYEIYKFYVMRVHMHKKERSIINNASQIIMYFANYFSIQKV